MASSFETPAPDNNPLLSDLSESEMIRNAKILMLDDEVSSTQLMEHILRFYGYTHIRICNDSKGFLALFVEFQPDLIIIDLLMPYPDGFQLLAMLRPLIGGENYLPIVVLSAERGTEAKRRALSSGAIDFIMKPFVADEVRLRVRNLLHLRFQHLQLQQQKNHLEEEVVHRTQELEGYQLALKEAQYEVILRLARAAEHHDDETAQHTQRVGLTCASLAQVLELPDEQVSLIRGAAPLHDVGKIGIPDSVLLKPGKFTDAEREVMKRHCMIGADLLSGGHSNLMQVAERIAMTHHEKWDGSGYPRGLRGDDIPIEARILAVADVFDALTHDRPYKVAWPVEEAIAELVRQKGWHFDSHVVDAFLSLPYQDFV